MCGRSGYGTHSIKEIFYLTYGLYSASNRNIVSAQVIYVDYSLNLEEPYADIFYSDWDSLNAIFLPILPEANNTIYDSEDNKNVKKNGNGKEKD